jgi:hypothetical protein
LSKKQTIIVQCMYAIFGMRFAPHFSTVTQNTR